MPSPSSPCKTLGLRRKRDDLWDKGDAIGLWDVSSPFSQVMWLLNKTCFLLHQHLPQEFGFHWGRQPNLLFFTWLWKDRHILSPGRHSWWLHNTLSPFFLAEKISVLFRAITCPALRDELWQVWANHGNFLCQRLAFLKQARADGEQEPSPWTKWTKKRILVGVPWRKDSPFPSGIVSKGEGKILGLPKPWTTLRMAL